MLLVTEYSSLRASEEVSEASMLASSADIFWSSSVPVLVSSKNSDVSFVTSVDAPELALAEASSAASSPACAELSRLAASSP